ncbi:immunity 49 family protein [Photobacterium sp. CAU 1568]|uniref:Immunity 49 family protein n=1 Tax=Photobacterium arenosum TaxID=2774143 RepID=A0ABR9BLZ0_9GAMM|nr:immunity 49 family protein [Photobacterium arenosum]MBD8513492.1 immunity 49 family protein [Photobacterium arenosum]
MKKPTDAELNDWIEDAYQQLERKERLAQEGFREKHNLPLEGYYSSKGDYYLDISICQALLGNKDLAIEALETSVENAVIPYHMAFDQSCELRIKATSNYLSMPETHAVLMRMAAFDNDEFNQKHIAFIGLPKQELEDLESQEMIQTITTLSHILRHHPDETAEAALKSALDHTRIHPIKGGWRARTYVINLALFSIVRREQKTFDEALVLFLKDYEREAKGEIRGLPIAYVSMEAVGLVKLARRYGLKYDGDNPLIPAALL